MKDALRWIWAWHIKERARRCGEKTLRWIAWHLPRNLVKWCYVRVGAHATSGQYGDTVVPELRMMDALRRWDQ
jgi:hypothetical protein